MQAKTTPQQPQQIRHLYIHIPFCRRRCSYCDFNTYANMEDHIEAYVQALCAELTMLVADYARQPPGSNRQPAHGAQAVGLMRDALRSTIYFGGGTPSMLSVEQLARILETVDVLVPLHDAEITLEANPGSVLGADTDALAYLRALRALGINRLSMGVQSLHDPTLRLLGRTHTASEARQCFETARRAGFERINLDFIFGLPGQTQQQWQATLAEVVAWGADHFSLYSLILEERTPLYAQVMRGQVQVPDDDATAAMYEAALERFAAAGYMQYEISNWARADCGWSTTTSPDPQSAIPDQASHHNLAYWLNSDYLAAGAGAHGHVYPQRYHDLPGVDAYIAAVCAGHRPIAGVVELTPQDLYAETMFMGLRLNAGVSLAHFRERCGVELESVYGATLVELEATGLLERDTVAVRLTPRGRMLGNRVFERFV